MTDTPWQIGPILPWLDLVGIAVFAATGALAAARRGQTLVTLAFFALVTGVGGGTVRDLLIGAPVFWVQDKLAAVACLAVALLIWITPERWWSGTALDWLDALGLVAYAVFGAGKALGFGVPPVPAVAPPENAFLTCQVDSAFGPVSCSGNMVGSAAALMPSQM